ncbi:hypothetical protein BOTBODRAFT_598930 [Botryobasidium botryosum FD-172 SS1]|uniref:Protein kinase domain-containing protein n=1 Tax=Botryobasidium botryosum (strain FD-172 SS1) TaxID=930990 RepID=A0A067MN09_BOTB1|nr:hypothetical protein BOTBODRAFT_598930 [Botryobasidium botryosum FD-172 SS1]
MNDFIPTDVQLGHLDRMLNGKDNDINDEDSNGRTRLRRAVGWPDLAIVRLLVSHDVDIHAKDKDGRQLLHHAAYWSQAGTVPGSFDSRPSIMQVLLDAGADLYAEDNYGDTPLSLACKHGRASSVRFLLEQYTKQQLTLKETTTSTNGYSAIPGYIVDFLKSGEESEAVAALLKQRDDFDSGNVLLHRAAWLGCPTAVITLLKAGANPNSSGKQNFRPLHFAAELMSHQDGEIAISALINMGAKLDERNESGYTPLIVAASNGSPAAVRLLLNKGADPSIRGADGYGPLHYAFALMGRPESHGIIAALVGRGADVNAVGNDGMTPLLRAAFRGSTAAVQSLQDAGAIPMTWIRFDSDLVKLAAELMRDGDAACAATIGVILEGGTTAEDKSKLATALIKFGVSIRSFPFLEMLADKGRLPILSIMKTLREEMISLLPADPSEHLSLLAKLYSSFGIYPWEPSFHECEVEKTDVVPSAEGGFGECWKGMFLAYQKVAMKCSLERVPSDAAKRRAMREIGVWQRLQHPNVLPFIGLHIQGSKIYMLSPWMEKGDMHQYLKVAPNADRPQLLLQIAHGLRYLHMNDPVVIHGDLKCANIFISEAGVARLADFGLSHLAIQGGNEKNSDAWHNGGNPRWQAPELLKAKNYKEAERTTASDMFAFGRVIVEAFTGDVPFASTYRNAVVDLVRKGTLPDRPAHPQLDDRMWELMKDCSHYLPARRPSAQTVIFRLIAPAGYQPESPAAGFRLNVARAFNGTYR